MTSAHFGPHGCTPTWIRGLEGQVGFDARHRCSVAMPSPR